MDPNAFHNLSYGVYLCTSWDEGRPVGCVANSALQITSAPATVAISINRNNYTHKCIEDTGHFAVCVLGEQVSPQLIGTFGFRSSRDTDKFADIAYGVRGKMPVPDQSLCYFACKVVEKMETETHTVFLGEVYDAEVLQKDAPMTYAYYHKVLKGKTNVNAPTYIKEEPEQGGEKYVCDVCGYVYDGETPLEELPADWQCPICGMGKEHFRKA